MESPTLITTADGSHSLISSQYQVSYHSHYGAIQETVHVFIEAGLTFQIKKRQPIRLLELGFGSGLNAMMTFLESREKLIPVDYTTLEPYPISWSLANRFNYLQLLKATEYSNEFHQMHNSPFGEWISFENNFRFRKLKEDATSFSS